MVYTIPNSADAFNSRQAQPDSIDFSVLAQEHQAQGVRYGLAVTQRGAGANMSVDVAVGGMVWNGLDISNAVVVTNKAIAAADATNPRFDLVCAKNDGTLTVTTGTPAANPVFPAVPASSVVLAAVYVPANAASILTSYVTDKRCMIHARMAYTPPPLTANTMDDEFDDTPGNSGLVNGLNARWAWRNQGAATIDFATQGWATISSPAAANQNFRIIEQAIPAAQNYTVEARFSFSGFGQEGVSDSRGGIMLIDGVNGDFYECGLEIIAVQSRIEVARWTNVTTYFGGAFVVGEGTHASAHGVNNIYIRIQYVNATTTFTMFISQDGIGWQKCYTSWVDAVIVTKIGIGIGESSNQGLSKLHCDYFRRIA